MAKNFYREKMALALVLMAAALLIGWDIWDDLSRGAKLQHVSVELVILALLLGGVIWLWTLNRELGSTVRRLSVDLQRIASESEGWRRENESLTLGLSQAIDRQFESWKFSHAEKEIALLLLKGLSLKEIGDLRNTSERTVRQQAQAIYAKSNLGGRAELSAFFLEDLLQAPPTQ